MAKETFIKITKRMRGEDGYKVFSVRIKNETVSALDELSQRTDRSRNELIGMILGYAVDHIDVIEA